MWCLFWLFCELEFYNPSTFDMQVRRQDVSYKSWTTSLLMIVIMWSYYQLPCWWFNNKAFYSHGYNKKSVIAKTHRWNLNRMHPFIRHPFTDASAITTLNLCFYYYLSLISCPLLFYFQECFWKETIWLF